VCSLGYVRAALGGIADPSQRVSDVSIRLRCDLRAVMWPSVVRELRGRLCRHLAVATLATALADLDHAAAVLAEPVSFER